MLRLGEAVHDPGNPDRRGVVVRIRENPVCFLRTIGVEWEDGDYEEIGELAFGDLDD